MLNKNIFIDLHIHSIYSEYKDGKIVKNSTADNLDTLVEKLINNKISLCAITDHNRFNYDLYKKLNEKIKNSGDSILQHNLPGIEFDVCLEKDKKKCHIVAIFDDSDDSKVQEIETKVFKVKKLTNKDDAYTIDDFEKILRLIGLKTILIVHQRQGLDNSNGDTDSLSNATSNPMKFMQIGFIDCLEYNYHRNH